MFASKHRKYKLFPLVNRQVVPGLSRLSKVYVFKVYVPFSCPIFLSIYRHSWGPGLASSGPLHSKHAAFCLRVLKPTKILRSDMPKVRRLIMESWRLRFPQTYTYTHTHMQAHAEECRHMQMRTRRCAHTHTHTHTNTHTHTPLVEMRG